jgi:hypothetical protein
MGQSLAVLETYLKDIIFTEEQIVSQVETRDHIFEIRDAENSLGFISLYDLKAYVFEHEEEAKNYDVKNIDAAVEEWKNIYEHPYFQRRKPQLISADNLKDADDQEFFILIKGQKTGPYEKYELSEMVDKKEILLTDMVSFNGGHTWVKLFLVDGFDRRTLKESSNLPGMPDSEIFERSADGQTSAIIGDTTDGFISLAFLGNQKKGKILERQQGATLDDEMKKSAAKTSWYKWLLIASIAGIIYFLYNIRSTLQSPFNDKTTPAIGEQSEMLKPVEVDQSFDSRPTQMNHRNDVNDQRRMGKFETRPMNPVRPANRKSFMETTKFRENSGSAAPDNGEDQNYYYDNAAPMELDPVRAQISKENFDNGAEPAPMTESTETLFNQEVSN